MAIERSVGIGFNDPMDIEPIQSVEPTEWNTLGDLSPLPDEIFLRVLENCEVKDVITTLFTNRRWLRLASDSSLWKKIFDREGLPYFDEKKCLKYRGDPGTVPLLSWPRAYGFYNSPCTLPRALFEPEKLRRHTHKLQLFYSELDNHPTTLNLVGERAKTPNPGSGGIEACFHEGSWEPALVAYGDEPLGDSFWGFSVLKPLGAGELKTLEEKLADAELHTEYLISRPVERSIANFDHVVEGHGYIDGRGTYAICDAIVKHDFGDGVVREVRVVLGGARAPAGLDVYDDFFNFDFGGVALLRKC